MATNAPTQAGQTGGFAEDSVRDIAAIVIILFGSVVGILFSIACALRTKATQKLVEVPQGSSSSLILPIPKEVRDTIDKVASAIAIGANAFLFAEYTYLAVFCVLFSGVLIGALVPLLKNTPLALLTTSSFIVGCIASVLCGWIGMKIAVYANSRTALSATRGWTPAFNSAFNAGCVMGFSLVSIGVLFLFGLVNLYVLYWKKAFQPGPEGATDTLELMEAIAGFGLGGSSIALFGRVGGGIYTKAADVGADMCGKQEFGLDEDDPRNPAVIADNVGDNVGDIAGMGADLFGSFAESACALMVISARSPELYTSYSAMVFPMIVQGAGLIVCFLTSFVATHIRPVTREAQIETALKEQLIVSTLLMTPICLLLTQVFLPKTFTTNNVTVSSIKVFVCLIMGLWSGLIIGFITEYFTSHSYRPVRQVAESSKTGAATVIIYGLALGYKSTIIPVVCLSATIYVNYQIAELYGIASAAIGILSTMSIGLTIDAYGPICDNAGGIAEMAKMGKEIREKTDAMDAAGNTTAAIGKGFAIGSAAFVSLALFGAFVESVDFTRNADGRKVVNVLEPFTIAGILFGAMLPYWFSAMTMKSVGFAAEQMVAEVRRQFTVYPGIAQGTEDPRYDECVAISTKASLKEMLAPGALVMFTPLIVGFLFGCEALAGVLVGTLTSGVQMALSASNTGGAWDNAKKYIEKGALGEGKGKGSKEHAAAVTGDTVGDPLKDTSGPALNILIKLSAIISLVFARAFPFNGVFGLIGK